MTTKPLCFICGGKGYYTHGHAFETKPCDCQNNGANQMNDENMEDALRRAEENRAYRLGPGVVPFKPLTPKEWEDFKRECGHTDQPVPIASGVPFDGRKS